MIGRLICFPYAGGSSMVYEPWQQRFDGVEVITLDYPGHLMRPDERPIRTMRKLVTRLTGELEDRFNLPYVLCGSSLGALVAFEVAVALSALGAGPCGLVVLACPAPDALPLHPPVAGLPDRQFLDTIVARYGGSVRHLLDDESAAGLVLPMIRADMELFEAYSVSSTAAVSCPVAAVVGTDDVSAPLEDTRAWRRHTTASVDVMVVPGGHFIIETHRDAVLDFIAPRVHSMLLTADGRDATAAGLR